MWAGLRLELGPTRATGSTWSPLGGVREPGRAKSPAGDVWAWLRLEIELGLARATGSIWSLVGGIREPGWAKSPVGDVWAGLRLEIELGLARATCIEARVELGDPHLTGNTMDVL